MSFLVERTVKRLIEAEQRQIDLNKSEAKRKYHQNRISAMKKVAEEYMLSSERKLIYVCSPYAGAIEENTENAKKYSKFVVEKGNIPMTPHLYFTQFLSEATERPLGCELGLSVLEHCDEMWVFGEKIDAPEKMYISAGMKQEILYCKRFDIPIKYIVSEPARIESVWDGDCYSYHVYAGEKPVGAFWYANKARECADKNTVFTFIEGGEVNV